MERQYVDDDGYRVKVKRFARSTTQVFGEDVPSPDADVSSPEIPLPPRAERKRWRVIGRGSLFALLFLVPFFFFPQTVAPVEIGKTILAIALLASACISFFAITIERRALQYPKSITAITLLLFLFAVTVSTFASKAWPVSLYGNLAKPDSALSFLIYGLTFFLAFYFLREEDVPRVGKFFFGGVTLLTAIVLLQLFRVFIFPWGFARQATFNPAGGIADWGLLMGALLVVIAAAPQETFDRKKSFLLYGAGALSAIGLFVINSQLIWGMIAFLMIVIAAARFVRRAGFGMPLTIAVVALFFALVSHYLPSIVSLPAELQPGFSPSLSAAKGVLMSWRAFFGFGPATFGYAYSLFRAAATNAGGTWGIRFEEGHDFFTTIFVTGGIAGFLALLFFAITFIRSIVRRLDNEYLFAIGSGVFFLALGWLFSPIFFSGLLSVFFGIGLIASLSANRRDLSFHALSRSKLFGVFVVIASAIAASLALLYIIGQKYAAAVNYKDGVDAINAGNLPQALIKLQAAVDLDPLRDEYWRAASQAVLLETNDLFVKNNGAPGNNGLQTQILKAAATAINTARQATAVNPNDAMNWNNLGNVYQALVPIAQGADTVAVISYGEAAKRDPQNPQNPISIAQTLIAVSDKLRAQGGDQKSWAPYLDTAQANLETAAKLKPDYAQAYFLLAQVYIRKGDIPHAIQNTEQIKAQNPFDSGIAFQLGLLYYQSGAFDQAQTEFERAVGIDENYSNARYFLGLIYDRKGLKQMAIGQFQKIAALNPDNAEVKRILGNLAAGRSALQDVSPPAPPPEKRSNVPVPEEKSK